MTAVTFVNTSAHDMSDIETGSVQLAIGSPPFWGGVKGQRKYKGDLTVSWPSNEWLSPFSDVAINCPPSTCVLGEEVTWQEYIGHMVLCIREAWRVLSDDGVLVLDIGDKYIDKNQLLIPEKLAMVASCDGWFVRNVLPWVKPQGMPGPPHGKFHLSHHSILMMTKSVDYHWDSDQIRRQPSSYKRKGGHASYTGGGSANHGRNSKTLHQMSESGRNARTGDVWADSLVSTADSLSEYSRYLRYVSAGGEGCVLSDSGDVLGIMCPTQQGGGNHFAAWPEKLVEMFVKAGSRPGDTVLDMFAGTGTTGKVCLQLGRDVILSDISKEYLNDLSYNRTNNVQMELFV